MRNFFKFQITYKFCDESKSSLDQKDDQKIIIAKKSVSFNESDFLKLKLNLLECEVCGVNLWTFSHQRNISIY